MKKILCVILSLILTVCFLNSCSVEKTKITDEQFTLTKNDILRNNIKTNLAEKYNSIKEVTTYKFEDGRPEQSWELYYEKAGDSYNAIVHYGKDYECYYYDKSIYLATDEDFDASGIPDYRTYIYYNENYDSVVKSVLVDDSVLKSVFMSGSHAEKTPDGGYVATFEYIATNDIAQEFSLWGIKPNEKMSTVYNLNKDMEINKIKYYHYVDGDRVFIAEVDYFYGEKVEFPDRITAMHNSEDKVNLTIVQNYGANTEKSTVFSLTKGTKINGNQVLRSASLFKDISRKERFDYNSSINEDTVLYAFK